MKVQEIINEKLAGELLTKGAEWIVKRQAAKKAASEYKPVPSNEPMSPVQKRAQIASAYSDTLLGKIGVKPNSWIGKKQLEIIERRLQRATEKEIQAAIAHNRALANKSLDTITGIGFKIVNAAILGEALFDYFVAVWAQDNPSQEELNKLALQLALGYLGGKATGKVLGITAKGITGLVGMFSSPTARESTRLISNSIAKAGESAVMAALLNNEQAQNAIGALTSYQILNLAGQGVDAMLSFITNVIVYAASIATVAKNKVSQTPPTSGTAPQGQQPKQQPQGQQPSGTAPQGQTPPTPGQDPFAGTPWQGHFYK